MIETKSKSRLLFNILNYIFMILFCFICIAPLWHVVMASISDPRELMTVKGILFKPIGNVTLKGYELVLQNQNIISGYINTLIYVVSTTILGTTLTIIAGYSISRSNLKLKTPITLFILFTMMFNGGLIPSYMVNRALGLINTPYAIIIPGVVNAFFIIMMRSAFEQLSPSYEESAKIDGAGPIVVLVRILLPMVKATIAVVIMFTVVMQWNSWFPASIYLTKRRDLWPLQLLMREILVQNDTAKILSGTDVLNKADYTKNLVKYSTVVLGSFPLLILYPFAQKYFVKGITLGGVKG